MVITGDARQVADAVGRDLGVDEVFALASPDVGIASVSMPPAVAAVLMSASTIVVALNAQLLRRVDLGRPSLAASAAPAHAYAH